MLLYISLVCLLPASLALNNGLARTPPMGWLSWQRYRCNVDCVSNPDGCIGENLYKAMADHMAADGYADVGYEYVNIDDCWLAHDRDAEGKLQPDAERFPGGINALAKYVHDKGLKFGIYEDFGNKTCAGYPGILQNMELDASTLAGFDIDYLKLDGCWADPKIMDEGYPKFGQMMNATGRPIVYSCSWPDYMRAEGLTINYTAIASACNLWRNFNDISDSWASVTSIIDYYGDNQKDLIPFAGPGHWNDPDMLLIGNYGLSYEQSRAQMGIWAILSAPLIMSVDLRNIRPEHKEILQNKAVIAVDQDPLGFQGKRIYKSGNIEKWLKAVTPVVRGKYSYVLLIWNRNNSPQPANVSVTLNEAGMDASSGYNMQELFTGKDYGVVQAATKFSVLVNPSGGVVMLKCSLPAKSEEKPVNLLDMLQNTQSQINNNGIPQVILN